MERENIARAAKGDANAFEALMGAYETKIYALCLRMMGNPHDGEDAAQEAMLRIWRTIGQYRFESAFSTWIYRVTASCCMDAIRKRQRHAQPSLEEMGETDGFDPADSGETPQEHAERRREARFSGRFPPCRKRCARSFCCGMYTASAWKRRRRRCKSRRER